MPSRREFHRKRLLYAFTLNPEVVDSIKKMEPLAVNLSRKVEALLLLGLQKKHELQAGK